jgi:thiamine monophosphate synthase
MIYPKTDAGLRSARARWAQFGGWLIVLRDRYTVTDDPQWAARETQILTGSLERALFVVDHPDLAGDDPPVIDAALVHRMVGRATSAETPQLTMFGGFRE